MDRAAVKLGADSVLMQRYETAHSLDLHRCLNQFTRLRKLATACEPAIESQNEAVPAAEAANGAPPSEPIRNEPIAAGTNGQNTRSSNGIEHRNGADHDSGTTMNGDCSRSTEPGVADANSAAGAAVA